ncbi:MAG: terpene cyclase/mutase family protein [Planctomycetota bacterium]|nr:terpene cyclase/mutase family protein [Planctomycetota bacterium]
MKTLTPTPSSAKPAAPAPRTAGATELQRLAGRAETPAPAAPRVQKASRQEPEAPALLARLGALPWWCVSTAFHVLLFVLMTLVSMALPPLHFEDEALEVNLRERPKVYVPVKRERPRRTALTGYGSGTPYGVPGVEAQPAEVLTPVFFHEDLEIAEFVELPGEAGEPLGLEGGGVLSDIPLGGAGTVAGMGLGGDGSGAFGRPATPLGRLRRAVKAGGNRETESAVDRGLAWLAANQEPDGHWDTRKHGAATHKWCDTTVTGLSVLAFLGAGHTEKIGKYQDHVRRAVAWLIAQQQENGALRPSSYAQNLGYANAIAGMALAEAAGMARRPETILAAQRAVTYGVEVHQQRVDGQCRGYRYVAQQAGDLSNTGWYIMQLKSAKVAGLHVPREAFEGVKWFLDEAVENRELPPLPGVSWDNGRHRYGYTERQDVTARRTAMGCLTRQFMGVEPDELRGGVEWMLRAGGVPAAGRVDLYYWYYGTLCAFQQGGEVWRLWNEGLQAALVPTQRRDGAFEGSWDRPGRGRTSGAASARPR